MSGSSSGRQAAPGEVTDWLARSFDDFFGNTNISSSGVPVKPVEGNAGKKRQQKKKDLPSVPESSKTKVLPRKRAKSSSVDLPSNKPRQKRGQSQDEPWVDRYKPETQNDLAVQKKKIEEVETWLKLHIFQRQPKQNREKNCALDRTTLELLCRGCSGDIRSAINSLQFYSMKDCSLEKEFWSRKKRSSTLKSEAAAVSKARKKSKSDTSEDQEIQAIGGKDASIFLFHALGKIIYCKREPVSESEIPQLPAHLSEYRRDTLLIQPEDIVEKSHMSGSMFNLYLHQNYVDFFSDIDDVVRASEYLSTADVICSNWSTRPVMEKYSASVATRGVIHSNTSRAFAHHQGGMGFRPLHKPQWFFINKKYQENCLAAKSLFSSFCLPPECLQTELLPYLAMLANPMRNQAQISFIQDVGRLPLKRHFGRLKLETLTDKDPGIPDVFISAEGDCADVPTAETAAQMEKTRANENEPEGFPLSSSQCSGSELPCSQPQPVAAQAIMEEDELKIEEYDSD
ncbi:hypothetical protein llap_13151 [Limosa lapponica baueri]|uniref:Checkpoint protein RAD24-like helical bundle domain-containing protein n=1 Tax=Limosa lapponica baueri TaxID=1758121 RepID=A0A2I0TRY6_LIMLA|nr:hypothetical protein llap_13151 [Limosa lapponica baueri]